MEQVLKKWGNSVAVRIPLPILQAAKLNEGDTIEFQYSDGVISIKKAAPQHKTIRQRVFDMYGIPLEEMQPIESEEVDWGKPVGDEVW